MATADLRFRTHFFNLPDPRRAERSCYRFLDLTFMAVAATWSTTRRSS